MASQPALLSNVLLPTDFSPGAKLAFERVLTLPLAEGAKVSLVHVLPKDIPGTLRKKAIDEAERALQALADDGHRRSKARFTTSVLEGPAAHLLAKRALVQDAELICLGRHGRRPLADLVVGTTAVKVLRKTDAPVLVVNGVVDGAYQRPLVAVEAHASAAAVLKTALAALGPVSGKVPVLHAAAVPFEDFVVLADGTRKAYRESVVKRAARALEILARKYAKRATFEPLVKLGDARLIIHEEAKARAADLVVIGSHAKRPVDRLLLGSVSEWVTTHAPCDVLVARL